MTVLCAPADAFRPTAHIRHVAVLGELSLMQTLVASTPAR